MSDDRCRDCNSPIRMVKLGQIANQRFPIDITSTAEGEYAVLGLDDAVYIKLDERSSFVGPLYTDHRRTCSARSASGVDPTRPLFPKIRMVCEACSIETGIVDDDTARQIASKFIDEHAACRRKAS